jgi:hypothetical protein
VVAFEETKEIYATDLVSTDKTGFDYKFTLLGKEYRDRLLYEDCYMVASAQF